MDDMGKVLLNQVVWKRRFGSDVQCHNVIIVLFKKPFDNWRFKSVNRIIEDKDFGFQTG